MNGVPGALQNRDPACRARQVNSRHIARYAATRLHGACGLPRTAVNSRYLLAVSTILTRFFTNAPRCHGSMPNVFPSLHG